MTASTDLDDTLANIRARAEAATDSQWEQEWWRCHAEDYFRAAMGGVSDLVDYFTTLTPAVVLELLNVVAEQRAVIARVQDFADAQIDEFGQPYPWRAYLLAQLDGADATTTDGSES